MTTTIECMALAFEKLAEIAFAAKAGEGVARGEILRTGLGHRVLDFRKPTAEELADPEWWGHAEGLSADSLVLDWTVRAKAALASLRLDGTDN